MVFVAVTMITAVEVSAESGSTSESRSPSVRATELIEALRSSAKAPSVQAAVARGGRIVYSKAIGIADVEEKTKATPETVYNIGSISKVITAVAVTQLIEAGKVKLSDPVQKFVPEFPDKGAPITVWNLLTHTSGIRGYRIHDFPGDDWAVNHRHYSSIEEAIGIFKNDPLLFRPGKYYFYSSYAVDLLQGVVERASSLPFGEYLEEHIFSPAGMTRSGLDVAGQRAPDRAYGYELRKGKLVRADVEDVSYKYASGGMVSTAADLVRLGIALNHGKLLDSKARALMWSPQLPVVHRFRKGRRPAIERFHQGLLWRLVDRPHGRTFVYMCGTINGFNGCLLDYTKEDLVGAMTVNLEAGGYRPVEGLVAIFRQEK